MRSLCLVILIFASLWEEGVLGRVIASSDNYDESTTSGHLYVVDSDTGNSERLKQRHIDTLQGDVRKLLLDLNSLGKTINMDLTANSVWDSNSDAWARNGEDTEEISSSVPVNCHFSGPLSSGEGFASFSFCHGVTGIIQTRNEHYLIEAADRNNSQAMTSNDTDIDLPSLVVTISRFDDPQSAPAEDDQVEDMEPLEYDDNNVEIVVDEEPEATPFPTTTITDATTEKTTDLTTTRKPPAAGRRNGTLEVGVYINANYTKILHTMGIKSVPKILDWVINRWNLIRQVYADTARVGTKMDIKVKRLEIWWENPVYYSKGDKSETIGTHLYTFCKNSPADNLDHKMMYTWETVKRVLGVAYVGGVCLAKQKCAIVMPDPKTVHRELHELGHNLGFHHEPKLQGCKWPYGFMGWDKSTEFKDCYRPIFSAFLAKSSRKCLFSESKLKFQVSEYKDKKLTAVNETFSDIL